MPLQGGDEGRGAPGDAQHHAVLPVARQPPQRPPHACPPGGAQRTPPRLAGRRTRCPLPENLSDISLAKAPNWCVCVCFTLNLGLVDPPGAVTGWPKKNQSDRLVQRLTQGGRGPAPLLLHRRIAGRPPPWPPMPPRPARACPRRRSCSTAATGVARAEAHAPGTGGLAMLNQQARWAPWLHSV